MSELWWRRGSVYQIYPRSFRDTNGDGVGDLPGITATLPYLADLGVDAVWISPFYPSPMVDFGYDVTDHTGVDPLFGTLADFDALVDEAHRRGLRVLVDFVPNHTSDRHPWFRASRSTKDNPKRDWYLWADPKPGGTPPNNWRSVFGGPAWTLDEPTGQYYYHAYLPEQPDLNWRNPAVRAAQSDVLRFWLDRGVDGFRMDACRQLIKDDRLRDNPPNPDYHPGLPPYDALLPVFSADRPETPGILAELRAIVEEYRGDDGLVIAELYLPIERLVRYYAGAHLPSNMHLISVPYRAADIAALIETYETALPPDAWPNWVLGNHDRSRIATRVGPAQARVAAMLLLTLRGTPILYYGDELGLPDVPVPAHLVQDPFEKRVPGLGVGRDPARAPMRWSLARNAGFCAPNVTPWLPVPDAAGLTVQAQRDDPDSMLSLYRKLIAVRRAEPALSEGDYELLSAEHGVLAYHRRHAGRVLLVALNLTPEPRSVPAAGTIVLGTHPGREGERLTGVVSLRGDEGVLVNP